MEEVSWAIILIAWCVLFIFSYLFTHYSLFKDYELRGKFVKLIFSLTFSTSCALFLLFLLEMSSFKISPYIWQANLFMFSLIMLYLIPIFLVSKCFKKNYIFYPFFFVMYYYLINFNRSFSEHDPSVFIHFSLVEQIKLLGFNGVVFSAFLSGFGAINCTYNYFNFFNEEVLKETSSDVIAKCKENIKELVKTKISHLVAQKDRQSMFSKIKGIFQETADVTKTIKSNEAVHQEYLKKVQLIMQNQEKKRIRSTLKGRLYYLLGQVLTIYSVYKIIMSFISFFLQKKYNVDPITRAFDLLCMVFNVPLQIEVFIKTYVSFIFVGILIFTNIRSFLLLLISMINIVARFITGGLSTQILMVVISEATGWYFMASVLLMRANVPVDNRTNMSNALSGIDFFRFHHVFDATFSVSAILTAAMLFIKHKRKFRKKSKEN